MPPVDEVAPESSTLALYYDQVSRGTWDHGRDDSAWRSGEQHERHMSRNQRIGRWGEQVAADYLTACGYEMLGRNLRTPYGEIDLVARKGTLTIFVEVKARTSRSLGPPEIAVGPRKQAHMQASAQHYAQHNLLDHWRIDVIAVEKIAGQAKITHFENALS